MREKKKSLNAFERKGGERIFFSIVSLHQEHQIAVHNGTSKQHDDVKWGSLCIGIEMIKRCDYSRCTELGNNDWEDHGK